MSHAASLNAIQAKTHAKHTVASTNVPPIDASVCHSNHAAALVRRKRRIKTKRNRHLPARTNAFMICFSSSNRYKRRLMYHRGFVMLRHTNHMNSFECLCVSVSHPHTHTATGSSSSNQYGWTGSFQSQCTLNEFNDFSLWTIFVKAARTLCKSIFSCSYRILLGIREQI